MFDPFFEEEIIREEIIREEIIEDEILFGARRGGYGYNQGYGYGGYVNPVVEALVVDEIIEDIFFDGI